MSDQDFSVIPQEIVYEIFTYVPEYGHRIDRELHRRSLRSAKVSVYCDLLRYCTRVCPDHIHACLDLLSVTVFDDVKLGVMNYLQKNIHDLLFMYLDSNIIGFGNIRICDLLENLGIYNVRHLTSMSNVHAEHIFMPNDGWREQYIDFYIMMILKDTRMITKNEFDRRIDRIDQDELLCILQSVVIKHTVDEHISQLAIRYFGDIIVGLQTLDKNMRTEDYVYDHQFKQFAYVINLPLIKFDSTGNLRDRLYSLLTVAEQDDEGNDDVDIDITTRANGILYAIRKMLAKDD